MNSTTAFIGGGNMATAILGGMIRRGTVPQHIWVVEPDGPARARLQTEYGVNVLSAASSALGDADLVIWAVKPQVFKEAAAHCRPHTTSALHLSVAAGIGSASIAEWLGTERVVRAMPNTPALIGKGMTALYARPSVNAAEREHTSQTLAATGTVMWVEHESQLDAVTALSGSGPAYVFYFLEAMTQAGTELGLTPEQAYALALGTFEGATALATQSSETPATLRQRVTSKGGTTFAAITSMEHAQVKENFIQAMKAAHHRAAEMGAEFGAKT